MTHASIVRIEVDGIVVRQSSSVAHDCAVLLAPGTCDVQSRVPVGETMDVQVPCGACNTIRRFIGSGCGRPGANVRPLSVSCVFCKLSRSVTRYTGAVDEL